MAKETYYFSHDSNALTDTKILNMRADYGLEGYGLYWVIIEMMRNEEDYKLTLNKNTYRAIKTLTNTTIDIEKFIKDCLEDYELFKQENEKFYSNSLLRRMQEKDKKSAIAREKAEKRWNRNTTDMQQQCISNANKEKENKEKENKKNKIKEIENKRNKIKDIYNSNCTNLSQVQKLTDKRNKAIDNFIKEFTEEQFKQICQKANTTDFLIGKNDKGWKADFDFIMRIDKATAILEGKYNNANNKSDLTQEMEKINNEKNKYVAIDTSDLTPEEYGKYVRGELSTEELIEKGRIHV